MEATKLKCLAHELKLNGIVFKLAGVKIGLLMNFNVAKLKSGIKRFVI